MKVAVLLLDGVKQIMLTPENDHEKSALKLIAPQDKIEAVSKWGTFDNKEETFGYSAFKCRGDYYRREMSDESLMLVISENRNNEETK